MIRELTGAELEGVRSLVVTLCANYDSKYKLCLPLDCPCYMLNKWWTGAYCRYFEQAVLPTNPRLEAALFDRAAPVAHKFCPACGQPIYSTGKRAKVCPDCAARARRKRQRGYMQNRRR